MSGQRLYPSQNLIISNSAVSQGGQSPGAGNSVGEDGGRYAKFDQHSTVPPSMVSELQAWTLPIGIVVAGLGAKALYLDIFLRVEEPISFYLGAGVFAAIVWSLIAGLFDLHSASAIVSGRIQSRELFITISICFLLILALFYLLKMSHLVSRGWFITWYILSLLLLTAGRFLILVWASPWNEKSRLVRRVAVYGTPFLVERVVDHLALNGRNHVVSGAFSDDVSQASRQRVSGGMQSLIESAQRGSCDTIILTLPSADRGRIRDAVMRLDMLPVSVKLCPDAMTVPAMAAPAINDTDIIGGLVLIEMQRPPFNARGLMFKTAMDYFVGTALAVAFAPVMALIALAIKCNSRGPVFFIQSRHGYNHRVIRVLKFRTMKVLEDGASVRQAVRGDPRVTRVGRFLRRTSLDELPQLFNVLRGDLSLIGPRPHAVAHNEEYSRMLQDYASRHKVKPGITGLAQVNGCRGETRTVEAMRRRVDFDLHYIRNWTVWLDLKIVFKTALVPFYSTNAY